MKCSMIGIRQSGDMKRRLGLTSAWLLVAIGLLVCPGCKEAPPAAPAAPAEQSAGSANVDEPTAEALRTVTEASIAAVNSKDAPATLATIHPDSPARQTTEAALRQGLQNTSVTMELVYFQPVGLDAPYAFARVKQKLIPADPRARADTVVDVLHVYKRDGESWKFWKTQRLAQEVIERPAATRPSAKPEPTIIVVPPYIGGKP